MIFRVALAVAFTLTPQSTVATHQHAVENNLRYFTVLKGQPDTGMSLAKQMSTLHVPAVSIAVLHEGKIEWTSAYGVTRNGGPPATPATLFNAASMSKPLTAVAVLKLAQDGRIHLDADINSYIKSWKVPENQFTAKHKVTVRELLSHTAGIASQNGEVDDPDKPIPTLVQMLEGKKPATTPPVRVTTEPGTKFAYSNGGYMILQLLIEDVTGKPFAQFMQQAVLTPLHMNDSTFETPLSPEHATHAATGYWSDGVKGIAPSHFIKPNLAAGGLWTTASDYAKFLLELQKEYAGTSHLILNQQTLRSMMQPGLGASETFRYGLGVRIGGAPSNRYFEHGGSGVFQSESIAYLQGDGVVILTSGGGGGALVDEIARSVAHVYHWPDFQPLERTTVIVNPARYADLVGTYDFIKVTQSGNKLMAEIPLGSESTELLPESETRYFLRDAPTTIVFTKTPSGKTTGLEFITNVVHLHRDKKK